MRYLFVTWDGGGNFQCVLPLARRLVARGHDVRFLGNRSQRASIETAGCSFSPFQRAPNIDSAAPDGLLDDWRPRSLLATSAIYRDNLMFGPAPLFAEDVLATVRRDRPDAVLVDYMLLGAVAAAEATGLPAAAYWHTAYATPEVDVPVFGLGRGLPRGLPGRLAQRAARIVNGSWWNRSLPSLNRTRAGLGLPALDSVFEQFDRLDRVLVMTSASFDFAALSRAHTPSNVSYVGPQLDLSSLPLGERAAGDDGGAPYVLASLSTTYQAQQSLLQRTVRALGRLPVRALVTTGPAVTLEGPAPANVEVAEWASHAEALPRAALVLCHAGHGTVAKSLAHGVPLVCIPMGRDQPCIAARVVHAGAGVRLPKDPGQAQIEAAIRGALSNPALRSNAERLGRAFREDVAADRAMGEIEALGRSSEVAQPAIGG